MSTKHYGGGRVLVKMRSFLKRFSANSNHNLALKSLGGE